MNFRKAIVKAAAAVVALAGCASTSNIDMKQVESECGQKCSSNYSSCGKQFTLFPIMAQRQCADALQLCVQACPARQAEKPRSP